MEELCRDDVVEKTFVLNLYEKKLKKKWNRVTWDPKWISFLVAEKNIFNFQFFIRRWMHENEIDWWTRTFSTWFIIGEASSSKLVD